LYNQINQLLPAKKHDSTMKLILPKGSGKML
jgi:hypothetical protein